MHLSMHCDDSLRTVQHAQYTRCAAVELKSTVLQHY
jgi:hypothetical protein